ncbi:MAG: hypothetical protein KGR24_08070 [Planctomycetes bacterium]|nr:hypothetical protein [Planctomycetota bacterium]
MPHDAAAETRESLERRYGIPSDRFCGLTADEMSRAIVAHDGGPRAPGQAVGYNPIGSPETRLDWLREAFGRDADVELLRLRMQFFMGRVREALAVDWMLDNREFDQAVWDGLAIHYPDLTDDARAVIAGDYSYSHAK